MTSAAGLGPIVQIGYAVPDAEAAARTWAERWRAGPFFLRPHIQVHDVVYRGEPSTFDHTSAYGQWGPIMVELMQDHGTAPSAVRERYAPDETGVHHMSCFADDFDAAIATLSAAGHVVVMTAVAGRTPFGFVQMVPDQGHLLEIYPRSPRLEEFYAMVAAAADGWDGTDPVRLLG